MLQQTQVASVIPYFTRFIRQFPSIEALAHADLNDVLKCWEGLGYYSRARNLFLAAKTLIEQGYTSVPDDFQALKQLPGVGDYTASAILSIAFNYPFAVVDGNVKRVLSRLMCVEAPANRSSSLKTYKKLATELLMAADPGNYNQAIMELGALVCRPVRPECKICPLTDLCAAHRTGTVRNYPVVEKKPRIPTYRIAVGVVVKARKILITRRADKGLLGGLWEFPGGKLEGEESAANACVREIKEETGLKVDVLSQLATVNHAYSHFRIKMDVFICLYLSGIVSLAGPVDHSWITLNQIQDYPLPKANHKFIPGLKKWLTAYWKTP